MRFNNCCVQCLGRPIVLAAAAFSILLLAVLDCVLLAGLAGNVGDMSATCQFVANFDLTCVSGPTQNIKKVQPTQKFVSVALIVQYCTPFLFFFFSIVQYAQQQAEPPLLPSLLIVFASCHCVFASCRICLFGWLLRCCAVSCRSRSPVASFRRVATSC